MMRANRREIIHFRGRALGKLDYVVIQESQQRIGRNANNLDLLQMLARYVCHHEGLMPS